MLVAFLLWSALLLFFLRFSFDWQPIWRRHRSVFWRCCCLYRRAIAFITWTARLFEKCFELILNTQVVIFLFIQNNDGPVRDTVVLKKLLLLGLYGQLAVVQHFVDFLVAVVLSKVLPTVRVQVSVIFV